MKFDFTRPLHTLTLIKYRQETSRVEDVPPFFLPSFTLSVRQSFLFFFFAFPRPVLTIVCAAGRTGGR